MNEKYGFVYIWRDRKHKRYYIGCHWGTVDDGYICSSNWMRDAYKRRPEDFKRRILKTNIFSKKETFESEQYYFNMIKPEELRLRYYNLNIKLKHWLIDDQNTLSTKLKMMGNTNHTGKLASEETKRKMSEARKGKPSPNKGKIFTKEEREKSSLSKKGKSKSLESRQNYSDAMKLRWANKEYKDRLIKSKSKFTYYIVNIDGKIIKTNNLREWCDENSINTPTLRDTYKSRKFSDKYGYLLFAKVKN